MHAPTVSLSRLNIETAYKYPIGAPRVVYNLVTSKVHVGQHHDEIISQLTKKFSLKSVLVNSL